MTSGSLIGLTSTHITPTYEEARSITRAAQEKNVLVGCAPDTFLGGTYQTARKLIDSGIIGEVLSSYAFCLTHGVERHHPSPAFMYQQGGGAMLGRAPYYLTALISLIGPAKTVAAINTRGFDYRVVTSQPLYGTKIPVEIDTNSCGIIEFENGSTCMLAMSRDVWGTSLPHMEVHGTLGSLILPDPNEFGGDILFKSYESNEFQRYPLCYGYTENCRGLGLSDMVACMQEGSAIRANAEMAAHVVEIADAYEKSWQEKRFISLESTCSRPRLLEQGLFTGSVRLSQ